MFWNQRNKWRENNLDKNFCLLAFRVYLFLSGLVVAAFGIAFGVQSGPVHCNYDGRLYLFTGGRIVDVAPSEKRPNGRCFQYRKWVIYTGNTEYSVNLPTRFYYKRKWNNGWINVVNPFRASSVLGTPGSGKSYAAVNKLYQTAYP